MSTSAASASEDEYVRLKLELASARAATDTARLRARQLISSRDGLREDASKNRAEAEEQQLILEQTRESNEKLRAQIRDAEEERDRLLSKIEEKGDDG
mmetsp:Transcript_41150/g.87689  ORF Transcript_41150/g.87689 Transcript_41150/m.87689 type:complete len:98 (-) Transcript_41150:354-647(-)|eukprot:CAMPEP_0172562038 /NCGR_PEP_ID=MMETSP1067-20121228/95317_1 /TAXON_ID=265564 ORGANISM="Thalassiosira punctigera, Strain Tpunct2005C2" /NCGR_SAMPLE_ID=MMETSP1067 /ASSEMBLY_ACC=CAM_ASM_000444 /LENGTH=97 /DNA_ID=CAMNT_0013352187 /DNA_START=86 /DNA_END=379 /DNA_ORIENTATION=-